MCDTVPIQSAVPPSQLRVFRMKFSTAVIAMFLAVMSASASAQTSPEEAKGIYDQMCAGCHGYRGDGGEGHRGGFSPHVGTLANKEYMQGLPDDYLFLIIKKGGAYMGKIATMP